MCYRTQGLEASHFFPCSTRILFWLEISVDDALGVDIFNSRQDLRNVKSSAVLVEGAQLVEKERSPSQSNMICA